MRPTLVADEDLLATMIDEGFLRAGTPEFTADVGRLWCAYRAEMVHADTAPIMVGSISRSLVLEYAAFLSQHRDPAEAGLVARTWAAMYGDHLAAGDPSRGSFATHCVRLGVN